MKVWASSEQLGDKGVHPSLLEEGGWRPSVAWALTDGSCDLEVLTDGSCDLEVLAVGEEGSTHIREEGGLPAM